jgi:thioredoxin reductase
MTEFNMKAKNFNIGQNMGMQMGMHNMQMPMHMQSMQNLQMQNINNNMNNMSLNQMNSGNNSFNSFSKHNSTTNVESEEKKSQPMQNGKYTCRFEIQIENDKEFQVARRLIGAKVILINPGL